MLMHVNIEKRARYISSSFLIQHNLTLKKKLKKAYTTSCNVQEIVKINGYLIGSQEKKKKKKDLWRK